MTAGEAWSLINDVAEATQHVRVRSNPLKDVVEAPPSESSLTKVLGDMTTILTEMHKEQKAFYSIQAVQSPPSRACVSIMPLSIFARLNLAPLKRSAAKFALANKSVITVVGIAEDILVVIKDLVFPVDFYVFEMCPIDNRSSSSILLGRPFLKIGDKTIKFNLEEAMRHPPEEHSVLRCDVINEVVAEVQRKDHNKLCYPIVEETDDHEGEQEKVVENELQELDEKEPQLEAKIGLKHLPSHLKCAFLEHNKKFLVIIAREAPRGPKEA
ncbi:uncharacterized protein LOC107465647 [Arachis duranensis]|uniref:Uncharacterized protein LOC107465647 n=1 Tax=Arachis duranensis TaxID=130453 RepID=A0A6P4C5K6_ARADU|nr:uncharacterized protein LOC107465647 [Arachis duranensis]